MRKTSGKITLEWSHGKLGFILEHEDGRDLLVDVDWDFPGLANYLGLWSPCHGDTDGTVDCHCGNDAGSMIDAARAALDDQVGSTFDDPGYFDQE